MDTKNVPEGPGSAEEQSEKKHKVTDRRSTIKADSLGAKEEVPPKPDPEVEPPIPPAPDYDKIGLAMQGDRMLLQQFPHTKKIGHILTPESFEMEIDKARVVAIGQDVKRINVGDVIFKVTGLGQMLKGHDGEEYIFLPEKAAIAVDTLFEDKPNEPILPGNPDVPPGAAI